jgi:fucokinase
MKPGHRWSAHPWDYLIVTASNERQAEAYRAQLKVRRRLGLLGDARHVLVVPDPGGRRIGSGGSTLYCLMEVLSQQLERRPDVARASRPCSSVARASCPCTLPTADPSRPDQARPRWPRDARAGRPRHVESDPAVWEQVLAELRILIVHAGGDSRRLPSYSACGKIFIPVPGRNDRAVYLSLFDRLLPTFLALPAPSAGRGQVVITSGDVLLRFDPTQVRFAQTGVTGLACWAHPQEASSHGVFCCGRNGEVRLFLQKPSIAEQSDQGAIDTRGRSCLDIGVTHLDAATAACLLRLFGAQLQGDGRIALAGARGRAVVERGLDFYREICCALGHQASPDHHVRSALQSGSKWTAAGLNALFETLSTLPFHVHTLPHCDFLDFGRNRGLLDSGARLLQEEQSDSAPQTCLDINNEIAAGGAIQDSPAWVEACRIHAPLALGGDNVVVGVDIDEPLSLPAGGCLDVITGRDEDGRRVSFVRCYGTDDAFKEPVDKGAVFCGIPLLTWLRTVGAREEDVWAAGTERKDRTIWSARLFPAVKRHQDYRRWLWLLDPAQASNDQRRAWRSARRYSLEQMLALADHRSFHRRRCMIRAK